MRMRAAASLGYKSRLPSLLVRQPYQELRGRPAQVLLRSAALAEMATQADGTAANAELASEVESLRKQLSQLETTLKQKEAQLHRVYPYSRSFSRTSISSILQAADGGRSLVMATKEVAESIGGLKHLVPTGTSVLVEGELAATPEGTKQAVELKATKVVHVGLTDATTYPIAKKKTSFEFLREKMHLRPRTNTISAVARIRNALAFATHKFFQDNGFLYIHTPIITASDCEGAGEMFQVTTLLGKIKENEELPSMSAADLEGVKAKVAQQAEVVKAAKAAAAANKDDAELQAKVKAEVDKLKAAKEELARAEEASRNVGGVKRLADGSVDYSQDFFGKPAYLTVSGQIQGELYACALSNIYTFGPTFRAEYSFTARHLAEFWMIEPEMAFCDLTDDMQCAEDYVRFCCQYLLDNCQADLEFINKMIDNQAIARLQQVASSPFKRCSYTEAIELLQQAVAKGKQFEFQVEWGIDLATEHERFLTEEIFKQPVIVYNYPKEIKAFYMKQNEDGKTVAAMDVLVPKVGELIGGSQREDRYNVLVDRMKEVGLDVNLYEGYLDIRKYGSVPHSGFGLGFERLILFATGLDNIREVIPFPRWPGNAAY